MTDETIYFGESQLDSKYHQIVQQRRLKKTKALDQFRDTFQGADLGCD